MLCSLSLYYVQVSSHTVRARSEERSKNEFGVTAVLEPDFAFTNALQSPSKKKEKKRREDEGRAGRVMKGVWLLEFYILTSKFISGWVQTCSNAHS